MSWLKEVIGTEKAIIAMLHLAPLPGDPQLKKELGMEYAVDRARKDLKALQNGGVDAIMFSNEYSLPYLTNVRTETVAEGQICDAIHRTLGARSVDGVKRRLRAGMGRCQGGFCGPRVVEILARELGISPEEVRKGDKGSEMLVGEVR